MVSHASTAQLKPLWGGEEDQRLLDLCAPSFSVWYNLFLPCLWSPALSVAMPCSEPGLPESTHGCCSDPCLLPTSRRHQVKKFKWRHFMSTGTSEPDLGQAKPEHAMNKQSSISLGRFLFMLGLVQGRDAAD